MLWTSLLYRSDPDVSTALDLQQARIPLGTSPLLLLYSSCFFLSFFLTHRKNMAVRINLFTQEPRRISILKILGWILSSMKVNSNTFESQENFSHLPSEPLLQYDAKIRFTISTYGGEFLQVSNRVDKETTSLGIIVFKYEMGLLYGRVYLLFSPSTAIPLPLTGPYRLCQAKHLKQGA